MAYRLTIPARINILGNPSDGNEGDFATLTAAVEVRAGATVRSLPAGQAQLSWLTDAQSPELTSTINLSTASFPLRSPEQFKLQVGALNRLFQHSPEWQTKLTEQGFSLQLWTEIPRQSGLGGSSTLILLTLAAMRALYALDLRHHHDYLLAELTQRTEEYELGIECGYADRYAPILGGLAYMDYRGKLIHKPLGQEPLVTYERLDSYAPQVPLVVCSSGVQHDSGDVHGRMRPIYLEEHAAWTQQGGAVPPMVQFMQGAWECAWRGKYALLAQDWSEFGQLMNRNHMLVDQMMSYCGFDDGAGWVNNALIEAAHQLGALGAKLTGAGGGGSVFALVPAASQAAFLSGWQAAAGSLGLDSAKFFVPQIAKQGLTVEALI